MPQDIVTPVLRNVDLRHGYHLIEFSGAEFAGAQPAQFFMVGVPGSQTLLRRPFSVCGVRGTFRDRPADAVQVLYKVVGKGTGQLAALKPGAALNVLGPLGRGFTPPERPDVRPVMVLGGIGSAPFPALIASLKDGFPRPLVLYGGRSAGDLPLLDWFQDHAEVVITTDDGSLGARGLVTEPLEDLLAGGDPAAVKLYACGPEPMLKAVGKLALHRGADCELSLEAHMACGFGVCLGCVVPTCRHEDGKTHYDRVCKEGPVMRPEVLAW
jgi:dihydroorotate dehydrogenase electron transfer subunit